MPATTSTPSSTGWAATTVRWGVAGVRVWRAYGPPAAGRLLLGGWSRRVKHVPRHAGCWVGRWASGTGARLVHTWVLTLLNRVPPPPQQNETTSPFLPAPAENLENLILNIAQQYSPDCKGLNFEPAEPELFPDVGLWHPLAPHMYEDLKEYLNW